MCVREIFIFCFSLSQSLPPLECMYIKQKMWPVRVKPICGNFNIFFFHLCRHLFELIVGYRIQSTREVYSNHMHELCLFTLKKISKIEGKKTPKLMSRTWCNFRMSLCDVEPPVFAMQTLFLPFFEGCPFFEAIENSISGNIAFD